MDPNKSGRFLCYFLYKRNTFVLSHSYYNNNNFSQSLFRGGKWLHNVKYKHDITFKSHMHAYLIILLVVLFTTKVEKKTNKKRLFFFGFFLSSSFMFFALFLFILIPNEYTYFRCRRHAFGSFHFLLIMCAQCIFSYIIIYNILVQWRWIENRNIYLNHSLLFYLYRIIVQFW